MAALPFKVKAVYEYSSEHDDDLKFPLGQIVNVTELEGDDWYVGEYTDTAGVKHDGLFPKNFVEKYEPEVPSRPTRAARAKQEVQPAPAPVEHEAEEEDAPPAPATTKPRAPPVDIPAAASKQAEVRSPQSAKSQRIYAERDEPPPASDPTTIEPATSTPSKAPPPPTKPKSNAFMDRIAAFNKAEQAPLAPIQPGRQQPGAGFIKKPFVAPPPSSNSYIPPVQKQEPIHRPYVREEDPEIRQRQEDDRAAAEAAGLAGDHHAAAAEEDEDAPKPMSLKERMAMLQREQEERRMRQVEAMPKRERKPPTKKPSEPIPAGEAEEEELEHARSREGTERRSLDVRQERPRVPSAQRGPPVEAHMSPRPVAPASELLSGGEEADQSAAGETTEDDAGTIGPGDDDEGSAPAPPRHAMAPAHEDDVGDEDDTTEDAGDEAEPELDEEEQRKQRLRERMAKLSGGGGPGIPGAFNPFGAPMPPKRNITGDKKRSEPTEFASPPQAPVPIMPMPGMQRVRSPQSEKTQRMAMHGNEDVEADGTAAPPRTSTAEERDAPPPVPKGKAELVISISPLTEEPLWE